MTRCVALFRAVNLGPHRRVEMADLRHLCEGLGLARVRTVLASGNVLFEARATPSELERAIEAQVRRRLGLETDVMVRTAAEWHEIVRRNPLRAEARRDPAHLLVVVCKRNTGPGLTLRGLRREIVRPRGREVYVYYPDGVARSRLDLGVRGTARNWNTVERLARALEI